MKNIKTGILQDKPCPFCRSSDTQGRLIYQDSLVKAFPTNIPIVPGHTIICPVRHIGRVEELTKREWLALKNLIIRIKKSLEKNFSAEGFNFAWNEGEAGGQTVNHLHIHIVPRRPGDKGIYKYEPRKFLYRPGARPEFPAKELRAVAKLIRAELM
jgi:diadenosine tetraphosphate (Ap4A) HIT family hydrolase